MNLHELDPNRVIAVMEQAFGFEMPEGVIAGQAVTSAIMRIMGYKQKLPFNDVDLFCKQGGSQVFNKVSGTKVRCPGGMERTTVLDSSFDTCIGEITKPQYKIIGVSHWSDNPAINQIDVATNPQWGADDISTLEFAKMIIEGFDISITQCAIVKYGNDIKLLITDRASNDLRMARLDVAYYGTPGHTALRVLKKAKELPFLTVDIPRLMTRLQAAMNVLVGKDSATSNPSFLPGTLFSEASLGKLQKWYPTLRYYGWKLKVLLRPADYHDQECKTLVSLFRLEPEHRLITKTFNLATSVFMQGVVQISDDLRDISIEDLGRIIETVVLPTTKALKKERDTYELMFDKGIRSDNVDWYIYPLLTKRKAFFAGDELVLSSEDKAMVYYVCRGHRGLVKHVLHQERKPLLRLMRRVQKIERKRDRKYRFVIGLLENGNEDVLSHFLHDDERAFFSDFLPGQYQALIDSMIGETVEPIFFQREYSLSENVKVSPVNSMLDLFHLGIEQDHCVAGYWTAVKSGQSFIFKVESESSVSTLQVLPPFNRGDASWGYRNIQHCGFDNCSPDESHVDAVNAYLSELNAADENLRMMNSCFT